MTFNHEAVAALPVATAADKALIRAMTTRRFAYALDASESAANFVAVDPASGVIPLYLIQNNIMFAYDSTDGTTTADGVTCLVSSDGKRFKAATITPPYSVLTKGTVAQPGSPAVGDTYLIPTAATGTDWAGKDNQIGIYTAAGWRFAVSPIGRFLYVKDETAFYHRNAAGTWTAGVGSIVLGANSVNITNVLGAKASLVIKVENQTTNAPPASPVTPTAYIIGPSPTGAWAGNAGKMAICLVNGAFTIIAPAVGDQVYDKALAANYLFNGTTWTALNGAWRSFADSGVTASGSTTAAGGGVNTYSATVAPTTTPLNILDTGAQLTVTSDYIGQKIRVRYNADQNVQSVNLIALYRDSESTAIAWCYAPSASASSFHHSLEFILSATDTIAHTYKIRWQKLDTGNDAFPLRRNMTIEKAA